MSQDNRLAWQMTDYGWCAESGGRTYSVWKGERPLMKIYAPGGRLVMGMHVSDVTEGHVKAQQCHSEWMELVSHRESSEWNKRMAERHIADIRVSVVGAAFSMVLVFLLGALYASLMEMIR